MPAKLIEEVRANYPHLEGELPADIAYSYDHYISIGKVWASSTQIKEKPDEVVFDPKAYCQNFLESLKKSFKKRNKKKLCKPPVQ